MLSSVTAKKSVGLFLVPNRVGQCVTLVINVARKVFAFIASLLTGSWDTAKRFFTKKEHLVAPNLPNKIAQTRIGVICNQVLYGEREFAQCIKQAGENLGWDVLIEEQDGSSLKDRQDLDWVVHLTAFSRFRNPYCPNYLTIFDGIDFFTPEGELLSQYHDYNGFLLTLDKPIDFEKQIPLEKKWFFMKFYPTMYETNYTDPTASSLMVLPARWGNRLNDKKYLDLYQYLDESGFAKFYGGNDKAFLSPKSYQRSLAFDGQDIIKTLRQEGISLILHSDKHISKEIPSARIFQAVAAGSIVIVDKNPFVEKYFGDSVFYIDTNSSAKEIFEQIKRHVTTIRENPDQIKLMTKRAHDIYKQQFLLEDQLLRLQALHKQANS